MRFKILIALFTVSALLVAGELLIYTNAGKLTLNVSEIDSMVFNGYDDTVIGDTDDVNLPGLSKKSVELLNSWGKGPVGVDVVLGEAITINEINVISGNVSLLAEDSMRCDMKTLNSSGRASYLTSKLESPNGGNFAHIDKELLEDIAKGKQYFSRKALSIADTASLERIVLDETKRFFVSKLGGERGYVLGQMAAFDSTFADSSANHTGRIKIDYYYVSNEDAHVE